MMDWKRRSDRSGRAPMRSPGRPPVARREERRRFWGAIATEDPDGRVPVSRANQAAAFERMSRSCRSGPHLTPKPSQLVSIGPRRHLVRPVIRPAAGTRDPVADRWRGRLERASHIPHTAALDPKERDLLALREREIPAGQRLR